MCDAPCISQPKNKPLLQYPKLSKLGLLSGLIDPSITTIPYPNSKMKTSPETITTIDITPFTKEFTKGVTNNKKTTSGNSENFHHQNRQQNNTTSPNTQDLIKQTTSQKLAKVLHEQGFVKIKGHGITAVEIAEAFAWTKRLFDLPVEDKIKAPHPDGAMPHRGWSGVGKEKVYHFDGERVIPSNDDDDDDGDTSHDSGEGDKKDVGKELRKVLDYKESYEIGSEQDDQQGNIWLPEEVLPGFRAYMTSLYERFVGVGEVVIGVIGVGLGLDLEGEEEEGRALRALISGRHCQLVSFLCSFSFYFFISFLR